MSGPVSDIVLARWGGEEFAALLPDADANGAATVAERMRAAVEAATFDTGRGSIHVTVSAGYATAPDGTGGMDALLAAADDALYRAKTGGRNQVVSA